MDRALPARSPRHSGTPVRSCPAPGARFPVRPVFNPPHHGKEFGGGHFRNRSPANPWEDFAFETPDDAVAVIRGRGRGIWCTTPDPETAAFDFPDLSAPQDIFRNVRRFGARKALISTSYEFRAKFAWRFGELGFSTGLQPGSSRYLCGGIEPDRHRAIIQEGDFHIGAKGTVGHNDAMVFNLLREMLVEALSLFGFGGRGETGRFPFVSAARVSSLTINADPPMSRSDLFMRPSSSRKMRRFTVLRASHSPCTSPSPCIAQTKMTRPVPISPTSRPSTVTLAPDVLWISARISVFSVRIVLTVLILMYFILPAHAPCHGMTP